MKISGNEIKPGMLIEHKDDLWEVSKTQHVKPGKGGAFNQVEMKSVNKNIKLNERFRSSDTVEKASLEETKYSYLYEDEKNYYFMEPKSFEQINIEKKLIGEKGNFLTENLEVIISFYNEKAISVAKPVLDKVFDNRDLRRDIEAPFILNINAFFGVNALNINSQNGNKYFL